MAECWVVFKNWRGKAQSYLFLACAATFVNNLGYLFELRSRSIDTYWTALMLSYAGRVWVSYALFMFVTELVRIKIPRALRIVMSAYNVISYLVILTTRYTGLYYKVTGFTVRGKFPIFGHTDGIWHNIWSITLVLYSLYGVSILYFKFVKEKNPTARKRLLMVLLAMFIMSLFLFINIMKPFQISKIYDFTMPSFTIAAIFMMIAIFKYRLLDTATLAREYVIDKLSEGIIAVDESGEVCYANDPATEIFKELDDDPGRVVRNVRAAIDADAPIKQDGRIYSAEKNMLGTDGCAGIIYTITDDTQHYEYMEKLEEQRRIADEANRAKSSFLANMSHEIRTPINAVLGMDEMIIRESTESSIRSYAKDIRNAGRTLLSLVNDILDFSKIEEGKMEIIPTQYELSSLVNDLVNMIRPRAEKKGLMLDVKADESTPHILFGDEIRIKQVALNILTNAVKYTNEGKVTLSIGYEKRDDEHIKLKFIIEDTGIGMKEEEMDKLFSPFSRMEEKRNRTIEGTGLGMSIVRQLLDLMGSHLDVSSIYGKGSKFSFDIIQEVIAWSAMGDISDRYRNCSDDNEEYRESFIAPDAKILVVDDTEVNLSVFCNLLKQTQVGVDTSVTGRTAVSMAKEKHYDIIFIDHMMPDMDGIETLDALKREGCVSDTVCVALTANAVSGARQMYLDAGFADYMSKPIDGRKLEEMIKKYLPKEKVKEPENITKREVSSSESSTGRILVIDDDEVIQEIAGNILGSEFEVVGCTDGKEALPLARKGADLILLDINLVGMSGFDVLSNLKADRMTAQIPVMFITADEDRDKEVLGLKNGALDFIRKPFVPEVLIQRSKGVIALDRMQKDLKGEVRKQTKRAERLTMEMMMALSHTVDAKDHYTKGHSERVAAYSAEIGRRMGKSAEEQRQLFEMGLLHDIGKIGIPEEIINKTQRLTDEEFARIKEHTLIGCRILKDIDDMPELTQGARSHHERFDGKGYPDGLVGEAIPEVARIICVADCYDAMTSTRTYSEPRPQAKVRAEIERCAGSQFDPAVAAIMLSMIDDDKDFIMNEKKGGCEVWKNYNRLWIMAKPSDTAGVSSLPDWIALIPQIDVDQGITNCGSADSFMSVVEVFHRTAKSKADEIEKFYDEGDIENYTIKVHALKSAARIIGAATLSRMAKDLEMAGKEGNTDKIRSDTKTLLDEYRNLDRQLMPLDESEEDRKDLSDAQRAEAFATMGEIAQSMDYGMMESVLGELKGYRLSPEDEEKVHLIEDALMGLDWNKIEEICVIEGE